MFDLISKKSGTSAGELHLIVLWANARHKEKEILADIKENLQILECYDVLWQKQNIERNFGRFYGVKLDSIIKKAKECGEGRFLLCTVWDSAPDYQYVETSRGIEEVNTKMFTLKEKYRQWTGGGSKIHATNSPKETNHDITLLLGKNYEDYLKDAPKSWNGEFKKLNQDVIGTNGWKSLEELFYVLNNTIEYVVLRGLESLDVYQSSKEHSDIDVLVKDYDNFVLLLNGKAKINVIHRPKYAINIGKQEMFFDIWNSNRQYYDAKWAKDMFASRVLKNNFYQLNDENKFYELIYHTLIHKKKIASDYYEKAFNLYKQIMPKANTDFGKTAFDSYYQLLRKFMYDKHYEFIRPHDKSVYYNEQLINSDEIIEYLNEKYKITDVKPFMINNYGGSGYTYFTGEYEGHKLFIKWGGLENTCKNEYRFTKKLYDLNEENFIKPWFYKCDKKEKFFAQDYIEGESLKYLKENNLLSVEQKENIIKQLQKIAETLLKVKVVHRDIRPENFILTPDNKLKLMDMQFAVSAEKYKESKFFRKYYHLLSGLGAEYALGKFMWDDFYSLTKLMDYIGISEKTKDIKAEIAKNQGKLMVAFSKGLRIKIKLFKMLSIIVPVRSLRKKLRGCYKQKS